MYSINCNISLSGFLPSNKTKRSITTIIQAIQRKSPSDSFINLCVVSGEDSVTGFLKINSISTKIESQNTGIDVMSVVKYLEKESLSKLKAWSSKRSFE